MSEWREFQLVDLLEFISKGTTPKKFASSGINYVKSQSITYDGKIDTSLFEYIDKEIHEKFKRSQLRTDDILFSMAGVFLGKNAIVPEEILPANTNQALAILRFNNKKVLTKYVHYFLRLKSTIETINNISGQSAQPNINFQEIKSLLINLPPLPEQEAIASVLSSLDDKIDLLHRQNKTLEAMAEALFRQWFVEEAGEDWEEITIGETLTVKGGSTPSTKISEYWDGDIHWTTPKDLSKNNSIYLFDTDRKISLKGLSKISSGLLSKGTLLLSSRAPVGYLAFSKVPLAINQGYIAIIDNKDYSRYFIYLWLKLNMEYVKSYSNGSTFQEISKTSFKSLQLLAPPKDKRSKFDEIIKPLFEKIELNADQILTLERLRDALLPKLMSGEVRVAC